MKRTHNLFVDDLKVYQESHSSLKNVSEIIVRPATTPEPTMECQSVQKSYSNIARWWEEKVFRCWRKH